MVAMVGMAFANAALTFLVFATRRASRKYAVVLAITVFVVATGLIAPKIHLSDVGYEAFMKPIVSAIIVVALVWIPGAALALMGSDDPVKLAARRIVAIVISATLGFFSFLIAFTVYYNSGVTLF